MGVTKAGALYSWGSNKFGQLGLGKHDVHDHSTPRCVLALLNKADPVKRVACGAQHVCAVTRSGALFAWGKGVAGQLGYYVREQSSSIPTRVAALAKHSVRSVACGTHHTICATSSGAVFAFGKNSKGQLGCKAPTKAPHVVSFLPPVVTEHDNDKEATEGDDGENANDADEKKKSVTAAAAAVPEPVIVNVACGAEHSMAISDSGDLYTWGANGCAQLGHGYASDAPVRAPLRVARFHDAKQHIVHADGSKTRHCAFSIVLNKQGRVFVFGSRGDQLGLGDNNNNNNANTDQNASADIVSSPVDLPWCFAGIPIAVSCGARHVVITTTSGNLYSWGCGAFGQLGHSSGFAQLSKRAQYGYTESRPRRVQHVAVRRVAVHAAAGLHHTVVATQLGAIPPGGSASAASTSRQKLRQQQKQKPSSFKF
jgi:alpha-tubulin suppressor-like RCC1 family protein